MDRAEDKRLLLEKSRLFKGFGPSVIDSIIPLLKTVKFEADSLICLKGDESDSLYIVQNGEVEISVSSSEGKIIVLGFLSEGDVFGEVGLLDKQPRTANVTAKNDVTLYKLSSDDFDKIVKSFGVNEFHALTSYVCFLFRRATNNLEETVFLDASIRIARKIQELFVKSGEKGPAFKVTISQENLGRMAGLSREATNKALSRLEETGLIERKYKTIEIPDIKKFARALKSDY